MQLLKKSILRMKDPVYLIRHKIKGKTETIGQLSVVLNTSYGVEDLWGLFLYSEKKDAIKDSFGGTMHPYLEHLQGVKLPVDGWRAALKLLTGLAIIMWKKSRRFRKDRYATLIEGRKCVVYPKYVPDGEDKWEGRIDGSDTGRYNNFEDAMYSCANALGVKNVEMKWESK